MCCNPNQILSCGSQSSLGHFCVVIPNLGFSSVEKIFLKAQNKVSKINKLRFSFGFR